MQIQNHLSRCRLSQCPHILYHLEIFDVVPLLFIMWNIFSHIRRISRAFSTKWNTLLSLERLPCLPRPSENFTNLITEFASCLENWTILAVTFHNWDYIVHKDILINITEILKRYKRNILEVSRIFCWWRPRLRDLLQGAASLQLAPPPLTNLHLNQPFICLHTSIH